MNPDERAYFRATHDRWMASRNRRQEADDYLDEWWDQQCGACQWFMYLTGVLGDDWGVCSNPRSDFDGRVHFEHDGCAAFEQSGW